MSRNNKSTRYAAFFQIARTPDSVITLFGFTRDPIEDVLYLSDTVHHSLEIYDHKNQLIKKLRGPKTADPYLQNTAGTPFVYPFGMVFHENRLYLADTDNNRIVVMFPDGTLDRTFRATTAGSGPYIYPRRVSRTKNLLFFVNLGPRLEGGQVMRLDLDTEKYSIIQEPFSNDPVDVLARAEDLLVADRESKSVHHYALDGTYLGLFGSQELQSFYAGTKIQQKTYEWLRFISLGIVIVILAGMVILNRHRKHPQLESSSSPLKTSLMEMPVGKRRFLIGAVPGLGYWATSKYIEFMAVALAVLFVIVAAYFELSPGEQTKSTFSFTSYAEVTMLIGLAALVWTISTIHATGLVEANQNKPRIDTKAMLAKFMGLPTLVALAVILSQGVSEFAMWSMPALSKLGVALGIGMSGVYDVLTGKDPSEIGYLARIFPTDNVIRQALAWGIGMGAMFWTLAHNSDELRTKSKHYAIFGTILGILIWIINKGFLGNVFGSGFFLILSLGLSSGVVIYAILRKHLSALSITAVMAGAWLGSTMYIMLLGSGFDLPLPRQLMGFGVRASTNASAFFFITMTTLYVQHVLPTGDKVRT